MAPEITRRLITVYRSPREAGLYLYVAREEALQRVPEELLRHFGKAEEAMSLDLDPQRKLARAKAGDVLRAIDEKGYYLQLPPSHPAQESSP